MASRVPGGRALGFAEARHTRTQAHPLTCIWLTKVTRLIPSSVEGCRSLSWLRHTCTWVCQPSPGRGAPAAQFWRAQYIPSHLIPSRPIPSRQVTIRSHPIPSHLIPSSVEECRSLSWLRHTCTWVCQPSPRRGAPAARLRR